MKCSTLSTILCSTALGISALCLALLGTTARADDLMGENTMSANPQLRKATIAFVDSTHTLKAHFVENPDERAQMALEALLRAWGGLNKDDSVYFAAYSEDAKYVLSLVSDPGEWSVDAFPQVALERIPKGEKYLDAFRVEFNSEEDVQTARDKIIAALSVFVTKERAVSSITTAVEQRGTALVVYFSQQEK